VPVVTVKEISIKNSAGVLVANSLKYFTDYTIGFVEMDLQTGYFIIYFVDRYLQFNSFVYHATGESFPSSIMFN
jgi:hypothetical protein